MLAMTRSVCCVSLFLKYICYKYMLRSVFIYYAYLSLLYFSLFIGSLKKQSRTGADTVLLTAICSAISYSPKTCIMEHKLPPLFVIDDNSVLPDELQTLVNQVGPLMSQRSRATQVSAWHILNRYEPFLLKKIIVHKLHPCM